LSGRGRGDEASSEDGATKEIESIADGEARPIDKDWRDLLVGSKREMLGMKM
jgi:hypothetical protein